VFAQGLVFDTRTYPDLNDFYTDDIPVNLRVMKTDSSATNMEHMAVVKQFRITDPVR